MKRMLIEGMTGNKGGMETFIITLFQLYKEEYAIDFITVDNKIPFEEEFLKNQSHIFRITPRYINVMQYKKDIENVFAEQKYDVFWCNKTTLSSIDSLKFAKKYGVSKIICHSHASKNMGNWLTAVLHHMNKYRIRSYIDMKFACSQDAARWFFGKNIIDVKIIKNAIDAGSYKPCKKIADKKRFELGVTSPFVIGHVGRFSIEKNHKFLIDIFSCIQEKCDSHLILCGDGSLYEEIQSYVEEKNLSSKVSFLGIRNDISEILQMMNVFVFPSLFEGLPFALIEAQAAGVPCVVSSEVSREAKLTDIIEFVDLHASTEEWAEKILKYQGYEKKSQEKQLALKGFTIDSMKKTIDCFLNE